MKKVFVSLVLLSMTTNRCIAAECEEIPKYIIVSLWITPVNEVCQTGGPCTISSISINRNYLLKLVDPNSSILTWSYTRMGFMGYSERTMLYYPYENEIAEGLKIMVYLTFGPAPMHVYAETLTGTGYAIYFSATAPILFGCVGNDLIYNEQNSCSCSSDWGIPPWTAGLGGVARVTEIPIICPDYLCPIDFRLLAAFGINWANGDADLEDLAVFCDNWLQYESSY